MDETPCVAARAGNRGARDAARAQDAFLPNAARDYPFRFHADCGDCSDFGCESVYCRPSSQSWIERISADAISHYHGRGRVREGEPAQQESDVGRLRSVARKPEAAGACGGGAARVGKSARGFTKPGGL